MMAVQRLRNVRPRLIDYDEDFDAELEEDDSEQFKEHDDYEEGDHGSTHRDEQQVEEESDNAQNYEEKMKSISFGTLKQAQDALSRKRKRGSGTTAEQEQKLEALRERLRKIKDSKGGTTLAESGQITTNHPRTGSKRPHEEVGGNEHDSSDSESGPSEEDAQGRSRTSKHAPTSMSSKRQVTRKRTVVDVPKRVVRDPRFDAISQRSAHSDNSEKAYSFLHDYQKSEIQELKAAIKKAKSEDDKETLKRKLGSMENKIKAKEAREREQDIIRRHRKEEREKVQQGKTPYYLKKKDVKEKALVEKFKGMKGKDREKLMERRKKKEGQKEKKRMPNARRLAS